MSRYVKILFGGLAAAAAIVCVILTAIWHSRLNTHMEELDNALVAAEKKYNEESAARMNGFIEVGASVNVDGFPVDVVTADMVASAESVHPVIEPLLDKGYTMLINGAITQQGNCTGTYSYILFSV